EAPRPSVQSLHFLSIQLSSIPTSAYPTEHCFIAMDLQHDNDSAPAYSHSPTQDTLTALSKQLFDLQEQLHQLRLDLGGETQASSTAASSTPEIEDSDHKTMDKSMDAKVD